MARLLNVDYDSALGKLHRFWYWCADYAEDGDLRKHGIETISDSLAYDAQTLITARLVDEHPYIRVHDWWEYCGTYLQIKYKKTPEKWQRIRELYLERGGNGDWNVPVTVHKRDKRDVQDVQNEEVTPPPKGGFEILWDKYPRREGKKAAEKHYQASVKTHQDWLDIQNAMDNYIGQLRANRTELQFTKQGSTWFNNWRDYVNYKVIASTVVKPPTIAIPKAPEPELSEEDRQAGIKALAEIKAKFKKGNHIIPSVTALDLEAEKARMA